MKKKPEPEAPPAPRVPAYLVRFKCRECPRTQCGWLQEMDNAPRICVGIPAIGAKTVGDICGGVMDVIHDERPYRMA